MSEKKRKLPPKVAAMKAKKRRRVDGEAAPAQPKQVLSQRRKYLKADQLPFKVMEKFDQVDDLEGMCGFIEEAEYDEAVRDEKTGALVFAVKGDARMTENGDDVDGDDSEEWEGFSSDGGANEAAAGVRDIPPEPRPKQKTGPKKKDSSSANGTIAALPDQEEPESIDTSAWSDLRLSPDTRAALGRLKFSMPTPIQTAAIPHILDGQDIVGKASTGSGKTLTFGIPILEQFLENRLTRERKMSEKLPIALIMSPTRELAHQLDKHLSALCSNIMSGGPSIATLTGGLSLQKQQRLLKSADIVIGTPGRLWEVIGTGRETSLALRQIQFLVIDEADRLLSEGHFKEVEEILNSLDRQDTNDEEEEDPNKMQKPQASRPERQTLVFSATFDRGLQKRLASKSRPGGDLMSNKDSLAYLLTKLNFRSEAPEFIDVNPVNQLATGLTEEIVQCEGTEKDLYLYTLLFDRPSHRVLVFVNSIDAVRRLTPMLKNLNINAQALHSEMPQKARLTSLERFSAAAKLSSTNKAAGSVLIATDVAARGLDIPAVQSVIHYHLPRTADTYVHRSGRTARAGNKGSSIIICAAKEAAGVRRLVASVHTQAAADSDAKRAGFYLRTLEPERRTVSELKPRVKLAKRIADVELAKQRLGQSGSALRAGAEELGVEYDSEEFEAVAAKGKQGRGSGRKKKEREDAGVTKREMGQMRAELQGLMAQRVNSALRTKYPTAGGVDMNALLVEMGMA